MDALMDHAEHYVQLCSMIEMMSLEEFIALFPEQHWNQPRDRDYPLYPYNHIYSRLRMVSFESVEFLQQFTFAPKVYASLIRRYNRWPGHDQEEAVRRTGTIVSEFVHQLMYGLQIGLCDDDIQLLFGNETLCLYDQLDRRVTSLWRGLDSRDRRQMLLAKGLRLWLDGWTKQPQEPCLY